MEPTPLALSSTIRARHTCFRGLLVDPIMDSSRSWLPGQARPLCLFLPSRTRTPASRCHSAHRIGLANGGRECPAINRNPFAQSTQWTLPSPSSQAGDREQARLMALGLQPIPALAVPISASGALTLVRICVEDLARNQESRECGSDSTHVGGPDQILGFVPCDTRCH
jgi:hypothetical protein